MRDSEYKGVRIFFYLTWILLMMCPRATSKLTGICSFDTEFECDNGRCIPWNLLCDVIDDCGDGSDETDVNCQNCNDTYQHKCYIGGNCVDQSKLCDGIKDCSDWSDETSDLCGGDCSYKSHMFHCDNHMCIYKNLTCNGRNDCFDWSDEAGCPCNYGFNCFNTKCIPYHLTCDGANDCGDYSDEIGYKCGKSCPFNMSKCRNGKCIMDSVRCDGQNDCGDHSDESHCEKCHEGQFRCESSQNCIPLSWKCNGVIDCHQGEDESTLTTCWYDGCAVSNKFQCKSGVCVAMDSLCDGVQDCDDFSDEELCDPSTKVIAGSYGPLHYDCHCDGHCHPGTGACFGRCKPGWAGPTCQIKKVSFQTPIQNSGHKIMQSPLSIDGDVRTCPPPAIGPFNVYWEANLTRPSVIRRIRIYNPKDSTYLTGLALRLVLPKCTSHHAHLLSDGYMDILCEPNTTFSSLLLLLTTDTDKLAIMQICEIQIIVCSKQAFGDQCQNTCNCNGTEGCDDVFGTCADGCLSGWEGGPKSTLHCNALSNSIHKNVKGETPKKYSTDESDDWPVVRAVCVGVGGALVCAVGIAILVCRRLRKQTQENPDAQSSTRNGGNSRGEMTTGHRYGHNESFTKAVALQTYSNIKY
uniref:Low-density lipoprotein receptor-related protein 1B-like isoform X2 n=1 Tax=Crassostrea virginica TaxID=6565 RepID=A0A8B8A9F5_CRAVI|nr:low-density lipoprotein receptor-related protein 1B-like isoform X2 [Crassostrea virginica]